MANKLGTTQNSMSKAGASRHFTKMAQQATQLKGAGATTGGLATGADNKNPMANNNIAPKAKVGR